MFVCPRSSADGASADYALRWFLIGFITVLTAYALLKAGVRIDSDTLWLVVELLGVILFFVPASLALAAAAPVLAGAVSYFVDFALSVLQLVAVVLIFIPITYLVALAGAR